MHLQIFTGLKEVKIINLDKLKQLGYNALN